MTSSESRARYRCRCLLGPSTYEVENYGTLIDCRLTTNQKNEGRDWEKL